MRSVVHSAAWRGLAVLVISLAASCTTYVPCNSADAPPCGAGQTCNAQTGRCEDPGSDGGGQDRPALDDGSSSDAPDRGGDGGPDAPPTDAKGTDGSTDGTSDGGGSQDGGPDGDGSDGPPPDGATDGGLPDGTVLVSVGLGGEPANGESTLGFHLRAEVPNPMGETGLSKLSDDGRFIVFQSGATNLVENDSNGRVDVFLRDLVLGITTLVSHGPKGVQGNNDSFAPVISGDGRWVAYVTTATNIVAGTTGETILLWDRENDATITPVTDAAGTPVACINCGRHAGPRISRDGRFVAFGTPSALPAAEDGGQIDVYVRDRTAPRGEYIVASRSTTGGRPQFGPPGCANGAGPSSPNNFFSALSPDGRFASFFTYATGLVPDDVSDSCRDVYVRDTQAPVSTIRVTVTAEGTALPGQPAGGTFSGDGGLIAFHTNAALVAEDTNGILDVFVRSLTKGTLVLASVSSGGTPGNAASFGGQLSLDGALLAFLSDADNLVIGDSNATTDVFVRDLEAGTTVRVSLGNGDAQLDGSVAAFSLSGDGNTIAFQAPGANAFDEIFVRRWR